MKIVPALLVVSLLVSTMSAVWALRIERPETDHELFREAKSCKTDYNSSVALSVMAEHYLSNQIAQRADKVMLNVSMAGNSRAGMNYGYENFSRLYDWAQEREEWTYQSFTNCEDDWGTWVDLPMGFCFKYYGGHYKNIYGDSCVSRVWVCTNGFISFDNSNSTTRYS